MTCPNCEMAKAQPNWPCFTAGCIPCVARDLAQGPEFFYSRQWQHLTPAYKALLKANWPEDFRAGHELVKEAADARNE